MNEQDQKVADALAAWGVSFSAKLIGERTEDGWVHDLWDVSIGNYRTAYHTGTGQRKRVALMLNPPYRKGTLAYEQWEKYAFKPKPPTAASVLYNLLMDARANAMSFDDWCLDYGYSNDSMKAFTIYQACCKPAQELRKIFNHDQRGTLRELLEDY